MKCPRLCHASSNGITPVLRSMKNTDLAEVLAIEQQAQDSPWSAGQFQEELACPVAKVDLCLLTDDLAGYLCSRVVLDEVEILNVATAPRFRRQGVGRFMLQAVLDRSRTLGVNQAFLEVRASNLAAIRLYDNFGFQTISRRPGYYADGEDALNMNCKL